MLRNGTAHWLGVKDDSIRRMNPSAADFFSVPSAKLPNFGPQNLKNETPKLMYTKNLTYRALGAQEMRELLSEEWTGTFFFLNDRKFVAPKFQCPSTSFQISAKKVHCSKSQMSPWGKYPCPCSRRHGDNRHLPNGGGGKGSRAAGSLSLKYKTDQPPWPPHPA